MTQILLAAAVTLALPPTAQADRGPEIKRLMQPVIDAGVVPGSVVGIYENGKPAVFAFGGLSAESPSAPSGSTVYEIGSISKVFTGILLADAVERGVVKLDDPLSKWLPEGVRAPERDGKEILLWHLSTHTSGLPRIPGNMDAHSDDPYRAYGTKELWEFIGSVRPVTEPGTTYAYSNLGAGLLGTLLAEASNATYETLLRERVALPLGMTDTTVKLTRKQKERLAPPHSGGRRVSHWEFNSLVGCGGIRSTVDDMLKLVEATLSQGDDGPHRAITRSTKRRFTLPNAPAGMGLGWHIAQDGSTLWHNGQTGGYHSAMFVDALRGTGVVVLSNGADPTVGVVAERIIQMLAGIPVVPPNVRQSIDVAERQLDRLVGVYPSTHGFTIYVTREGNALMAQLTNQAPLRVWAESPTRFFYRDVKAELEFEIDEETGKAACVTLFQHGMEMRCERKEKGDILLFCRPRLDSSSACPEK
jgi:CubicO group peptidase (beta-lactamase class C family)